MSWVSVFTAFLVAHMVGDYLFQTDWQARHKRGGLSGDRVAFKALVSHVTTYTIAFVPALIWIGDRPVKASTAGRDCSMAALRGRLGDFERGVADAIPGTVYELPPSGQ